jgi:hypothetical protein
VKNSVLLSQAAGEPRGWPLPVAALGTSLPASVLVPLTEERGAFAAARPRLREAAMTATQQFTCKKYHNMTRIAANGGDTSGPHPAWDPV